MADIQYTVGVDTGGANSALHQLQGQISKTQAAFGKLQSVIGGLAIGAAISSALRYADALDDLSAATGIATKDIMGFTKAVTLNGGSAETAQQGILRLTNTIGEAAAGSKNAQYAFAQVGISLQDLQTLSEAEILRKTIEGLGQIQDFGKRATLTTDLLGKSFRGVNTQGVAQGLDAAVASSARYAETITKAAEMQNKLDMAFIQFKYSVLKAIEPLIEFVNKLKPEQIQNFVDAMVKIGAAASAIAVAAKSFEWLSKAVMLVGGAFTLYKAGTSQILSSTVSLSKTFGWLSSSIGGIISGSIPLGKAFEVLSRRFGFLLEGIGGLVGGFLRMIPLIAAVGAAIVGVNSLIEKAFDVNPIDTMATKLEELVTKYFPGLAAGINKVGAALGMAAPPSQRGKATAETASADKAASDAAQAQAAAEAERRRQVADAWAKQRDEIRRVSDAYKDQNDQIAANYELETQMLGMGEMQKELAKAQADLTRRTADEVKKLQDAKAGLSEQDKGLAAEYDIQIAKIQELGKEEQKRLTALIKGLEQAKQLENLRQFGIQQQIDQEKQLNSVYDEIAKSGLSEIEQKYYDIAAAANASALAAIRAEEARRGSAMSLNEQKKYYDFANRSTAKLQAAQKQMYEQSRTFSAGWKKAFNEYADNAMNAAKQAENLFRTFTQGIEDLLVNFVKTGKFEWKSFVESMAEEFLRSQIKQSIAGIMGLFGAGGGGGVGQGQGDNPQNPLYVYDVAGGGQGGGMLGGLTQGGNQGGTSFLGGLWDSISGLFGSSNPISNTAPSKNWYEATQAPNFYEPWKNQQSDSGGFFSSIGDAISGAGSWLNENLFGGFFANGGTLGAGRWGIAGENGPEMISGPAQVTPMTGGVTNVTYNINAVDAMSFKQMIAQDPTFIFAVTEQGRKSLPQRG